MNYVYLTYWGFLCAGSQGQSSVLKTPPTGFHEGIHPSKPRFHLGFSCTCCMAFLGRFCCVIESYWFDHGCLDALFVFKPKWLFCKERIWDFIVVT